MTRKSVISILIVLFSAQLFAADYIVKTKNQSLSTLSLHNTLGVHVLDSHSEGSLLKVNLEEESEVAALAELMSHPAVEYVVKDFKLHAFRTPMTFSKLKEQWAISKVNAEKAWGLAKNKGNKNVLVAVIDTGVDYNHESLKSNSVQGYDFKQNDNDPMDETSSRNPGHGTHCAGIIGANGLVNDGTIGLSPEVSIMALRFLGADGSGDLMAGIKAIDYAIEKGAKVISASWGATVSRSQAQPLIDAVQRASDAGVIFVAAAANDGRSNDKTDVFPANAKFENTISVAASDSSDAKPSWSNYGKHTVDLAAPGHKIMSTLPKDSYGELSGTSMATPLVSGLVALLAAQRPNITGAEVRSLMQMTGAKVSIETACDCRVDAGAAMEALLNRQMIVVPAAATVAPNESLTFKAFNGEAPFTFATSNASVGSINEQGVFNATAEGDTTITVTDSTGATATSLKIYVGKTSGGGGNPGNPGNPPGDGSCPIGDQAMCDILCGIMPDAPWCNQ